MTKPQRHQVTDLEHADKATLIDIWTRMNGAPPAFRASRELLILALAWEIQECKFGGGRGTLARPQNSHRRHHARAVPLATQVQKTRQGQAAPDLALRRPGVHVFSGISMKLAYPNPNPPNLRGSAFEKRPPLQGSADLNPARNPSAGVLVPS